LEKISYHHLKTNLLDHRSENGILVWKKKSRFIKKSFWNSEENSWAKKKKTSAAEAPVEKKMEAFSLGTHHRKISFKNTIPKPTKSRVQTRLIISGGGCASLLKKRLKKIISTPCLLGIDSLCVRQAY